MMLAVFCTEKKNKQRNKGKNGSGSECVNMQRVLTSSGGVQISQRLVDGSGKDEIDRRIGAVMLSVAIKKDLSRKAKLSINLRSCPYLWS